MPAVFGKEEKTDECFVYGTGFFRYVCGGIFQLYADLF